MLGSPGLGSCTRKMSPQTICLWRPVGLAFLFFLPFSEYFFMIPFSLPLTYQPYLFISSTSTVNTTIYCYSWFKQLSLRKKFLGLPWWHSGWESACQCRGHEFEPWSGKIPHAAEQLGREPQLLSLRVWSLCSSTRKATIVRGPRTAMKSGPCSPQPEKALAQKRRPNTAKNK